MKKKTLLILIAVLAVLLIASIVIAEAVKSSDPIPDDDEYGETVETTKVNTVRSAYDIDGAQVSVTYDRTENLSEAARSDRSDDYWTYDVFCDEELNEYYYLYNSTLLCGILGLDNSMESGEVPLINEDEAVEIAEDFLDSNRTASAYTFKSAVYDEMGGYYDISYAFRINGNDTDDVLRIWVTGDGRISSYSEFLYNRYSQNAAISQSVIAQAHTAIESTIASELSGITYSVYDSYLSKNNDGDMELVYVVDFDRVIGGYTVPERRVFSQTL